MGSFQKFYKNHATSDENKNALVTIFFVPI